MMNIIIEDTGDLIDVMLHCHLKIENLPKVAQDCTVAILSRAKLDPNRIKCQTNSAADASIYTCHHGSDMPLWAADVG